MTANTRNLAVLFADISGSTKLYELLGNADAQETIERCLSVVKRVCSDAGGRVVKTIGDEVLATFLTPDAAAQAAIEIQMRVSTQRTSRGTPIAMHIGIHAGPTIEDAGDVFGDAVNVAARMTSFATGGQIFTTAQTVAELSPVLRGRTRDHAAQTLKGKERDVALFEILWQDSEDELTSMSPRLALTPAMVKLVHGLRKIELGEAHSVLTLGRDLQSDVVIADRKASRMHARIERRRDKFVFIDHSSNGSWITIEGEPEIMIRREELMLRGRGRVSFGHAYADDPAEFLAFSCLA
ncbi:MAG: adenylate/guanylate cyclase domain-containing protein [Burkholderiales bacterium]|jgi:class 3 adenylate cyclase